MGNVILENGIRKNITDVNLIYYTTNNWSIYNNKNLNIFRTQYCDNLLSYDKITGTITIPISGFYYIECNFCTQESKAKKNDYLELYLIQNGLSLIMSGEKKNANNKNSVFYVNSNRIIKCEKDDIITLKVQTNKNLIIDGNKKPNITLKKAGCSV